MEISSGEYIGKNLFEKIPCLKPYVHASSNSINLALKKNGGILQRY